MRIVGLVVFMLVVFWATNVWQQAFGIYWTGRDVQFALALTLFFGTFVAVPVIGCLLGADLLAGQLRFPWSALVYVLLVALGCALYAAAMRYGKGSPLPTTSEGRYYYWQGYIPLLTTAAVPLLWRIARWILPPR